MSKTSKQIFGDLVLPQLGTVTIDKYTLNNGFMSVEIMNYGATILSIKLPNSNGIVEDIVLGYDTLPEYLSHQNPYFGATIGRVANRLGGAKFKLKDKEYFLSNNENGNTLHGGFKGFDKHVWNAYIDNNSVVMETQSYNGDQGFPGNLTVKVTFTLTETNELYIIFLAKTDEKTPVNLTNHTYFNIAGDNTGSKGVYETEIHINANKYTPANENKLPTGEIAEVEYTSYDLRSPIKIGDAIKATENDGFDINFCVNETDNKFVARAFHEKTGRWMEMYSDQPGIQFYTTNIDNFIVGKNKYQYGRHSGFCLESQKYPDALNHSNFPDILLKSRYYYRHNLSYKFGVINFDIHKIAKIHKEIFGTITLPNIGSVLIDKYVMSNDFMSVELMNYGATIVSIKMPDNKGITDDIALGYDTVQEYLSPQNPYFGATIGRVANRLGGAVFKINGRQYLLSNNKNGNTLHGGIRGLDKYIWNAHINNNCVVMETESYNGDQGFPGNLKVQVTYSLSSNNELFINFTSKTDCETPVNLTNHTYFNIAGNTTGSVGVYETNIQINANTYTPSDNNKLPTGEIADVTSTPFDLRSTKNIGEAIKSTENDGFDQNFCVNKSDNNFVAEAFHEKTGRWLKMYSDQPGVQFYTTNINNFIIGKNKCSYGRHSGFCLESQKYPDALNHSNFPNIVLKPKNVYTHSICYKFGIKNIEECGEVQVMKQ